jgi:Dna[CI] antecedent, DciA
MEVAITSLSTGVLYQSQTICKETTLVEQATKTHPKLPNSNGLRKVFDGLPCLAIIDTGLAPFTHKTMDQASRIIARFAGADGLISEERIACAAWKRAVGRKIAVHTRALKLVRNTLVVEVEDDIWRQNLWSLRHQILRNVAKAIGPEIVTDLEFRVMPPRFGPGREAGESPVIGLFSEPLDEADAIEDPGLRRIYKASRRREIA